MNDEIVLSMRRIAALVVLGAVTACNTGEERHAGPAAERLEKRSAEALWRNDADERAALRIRRDAVRGRVWLLGTDYHVRVYDEQQSRLLRQIPLPGWLVVKTPCMPDLILDRFGSAYISSNVRPWIWRIDASSFQVWVHEVRMAGKESLDVGFGTLAFDRKGALRGMAPSASSVWSIDVAGASATMIATYLPPLEACALGTPVLDRLEGRG